MELDKLREIIAGVLKVDVKEITPETTFLEDLNADSLDMFQILIGIEKKFDLTIPTEKAEKMVSVGDAVEEIRRARG